MSNFNPCKSIFFVYRSGILWILSVSKFKVRECFVRYLAELLYCAVYVYYDGHEVVVLRGIFNKTFFVCHKIWGKSVVYLKCIIDYEGVALSGYDSLVSSDILIFRYQFKDILS